MCVLSYIIAYSLAFGIALALYIKNLRRKGEKQAKSESPGVTLGAEGWVSAQDLSEKEGAF